MLSFKNKFLQILALGGTPLSFEQISSFMPARYGKHSFSVLLSEVVKSGAIEKFHKDKEVFFRLTSWGEKNLAREFPLFNFRKKPWDGKWRVLIYDIPDKQKSKREKLRRVIRALGFGKMAGSVYLSPFVLEKEIALFLEKNNLTEKVLFLVTDKIFSGGDKFLAEKIWNLSRLNAHYKNIFESLQENTDEYSQKRLKAEFVGLLEKDPFFPDELLPKLWYRTEIEKRLF